MTPRTAFLPESDLALFLDVDGTLLELAPTPDAATVPAALHDTLLLAAARHEGALALISGRRISDLDRLFSPLTFPAAGLHGIERRNAEGRLMMPAIDADALRDARSALRALAEEHKGLLLEDKGAALALHYRLAPHQAALVHGAMTELIVPLADRFVLRAGKHVIEMMPAGYSKRSAVEMFMKEAPFRGRAPIFIGDDLTDEDGFKAVNDLGGYSIRVGDARETAAQFCLDSVSAVIEWLREPNLRKPGMRPG